MEEAGIRFWDVSARRRCDLSALVGFFPFGGAGLGGGRQTVGGRKLFADGMFEPWLDAVQCSVGTAKSAVKC